MALDLGPAGPAWVAGIIFVATYALLVTERLHRAVAGMFGAFLMVLAGSLVAGSDGLPFFTSETAVGELTARESFETIGLLLGMMIIVGILSETGVFSFLAIKAAKRAQGDPWRMLVLMTGLTAFVSALLDNVTTILLTVPITIVVARRLGLPELPFVLGAIFSSNVGGSATLVGDPPNIIIGVSAHPPISFNDFAYHTAPMAIASYFAGLLFLRWRFARELSSPPAHLEALLRLDERKEIKDWTLLRTSVLVLVGVVYLFVTAGAYVGLGVGQLSVAGITLSGAAVLLAFSRQKIERVVLRHIEWPTLLFFAGLFVLVGGLVSAGVLGSFATALGGVTKGNLLVAVLLILWVSVLLSSVVDNIPFTIAMVPVIQALVDTDPSLSAGYGVSPLWWALAMGTGLGGNGTVVGSTAGIVGVGLAERRGVAVSFASFLRPGLPYMLVTTAVTTAVMLVSLTLPGYWLV